MSFDNKIFHHWRSYLKKRQELFNSGKGQMFSTFQDERLGTSSDDIVCVVCNDGDYEENDLIVYCSVRNLQLFCLFYILIIILLYPLIYIFSIIILIRNAN